ncbi:hypothetical protein K435DRAFT_856659 [Dendrothele bispora CBS 962.96]|uniref:EthD domain-containing protein n=1 Tax=Dendrothele bispora (strain CBS 962.96) TaxID=1314807 RepID=A0A4S8M8B9_DENBC|nr:hypothetical protein K435DRAFT_856659 [Dendrothele bispora CBS 962.96]
MSSQTTASQPALRTDRVRMLVLITKKPSISHEEFERHWFEQHSQVMLSLDAAKKNLLKYEQLHINANTKALLQTLNAPLIDCDGAAILEAESYETLFKVFNDPEFKAATEADEERFLDRSKLRILPLDFLAFIDK